MLEIPHMIKIIGMMIICYNSWNQYYIKNTVKREYNYIPADIIVASKHLHFTLFQNQMSGVLCSSYEWICKINLYYFNCILTIIMISKRFVTSNHHNNNFNDMWNF
jgi:hypothetical protein